MTIGKLSGQCDFGQKGQSRVAFPAGAEVFVTLPCASYVVTVNERATALEEAEKKLTDMMMAFDYENQ